MDFIRQADGTLIVSPGANEITTDMLADGAATKVKLGIGTVKVAVIDGGAAGDHVVTGITTDDELVSVLHLPNAGAVDDTADLTDEFTIGAADTVNNAGGTATTDGKLVVIYEDRS